MFEKLSFRFPFRKYQRMILEQIVEQQKDHKCHIVAPPGSGKTIVGLELIRQFNAPAVVFAPTTTIQGQWFDKLGMFLQPPLTISQFASMDANQRAPIHIFTYQLISTPTQAREQLRDAALLLWKENLVHDGQAKDLGAAEARQATLQANNPAEYQKEVLKYTNRIRKKLLQEPNADIAHFLHPNARKLIDELVAYGVKTIVLDECHHLLDYWAIVLRYLISRIREPRVIGLTATLPDPETDAQFDNYNSLLGDVDFEVPTPAVVKEGDLAPYRDLVYLVKPTPRETEYLKKIQAEFEAAIRLLTQDPNFRAWTQRVIEIPPDASDPAVVWQTYWDENPLVTLASARFLHANQIPLPANLPIPIEASDPMEMEDWLNLLERYGLDILKTSPSKDDHELLQHLRKVLLPFGLTLTERGISQARSPGDLVLTFSESKDHAVAHILAAESKAMGEKLRAVVVTDFEKVGTGIPRLRGVLEADAGSAVRAFRLLVSHSDARHLNPVLVTGKSFLIPAANKEELLVEFAKHFKEKNLHAACLLKNTKDEAVMEVVGDGRDWSSQTYVRMMTALFDRGVVKCLIGTRGIFGEGWDSLSLNTLIDLTSVTTSTSVQQLRGRTIRLDPNWKRKVAHNWDVVCVGKEFERGNVDFNRFLKRHDQYWGIVIRSQLDEALQTFNAALDQPPVSSDGRRFVRNDSPNQISKGILHVSPELVQDLIRIRGLKGLNFGKHNRHMIRQTMFRDKVYDLWGVGEDYSNFTYRATSIDARDLKIRTAFTLQNTLKAVVLNALAAFVQTFLILLFTGLRMTIFADLTCLVIIFSVALLLSIGFNIRNLIRAGKKLFAEQVPDAILMDVARALVETLRELGLISRRLSSDYVRVTEDRSVYNIMLDYASPEDAATFTTALEEIFAAVVNQRYLIRRTEDRLPNLGLRSLWQPIRQFVRETGMYPPAYHPVPKIIATRKERVEVFAKYWKKFIGGGEIVSTRNPVGRSILLAARAERRPKVKQMAFELWR